MKRIIAYSLSVLAVVVLSFTYHSNKKVVTVKQEDGTVLQAETDPFCYFSNKEVKAGQVRSMAKTLAGTYVITPDAILGKTKQVQILQIL